MKLNRKVALAATAMITVGALASCAGGSSTPTNTEGTDAFPDEWADTITIDVFDGLANYMGMQEGWFAKVVKDKFNMELNVIAPNVAGGGDTLFNTRVAAGDLGDLLVVDKGEQLDELIEGGLVYDSSGFYGAMDNAAEFDLAVQNLNDGKEGIYAFPTGVSSLLPTEPSEGLDPTFGPFVRWDLYKELGYPEVGTLEDLLPVLEDMQKLHPTNDSGQKVYAFSLFADWDGNMMNVAKQPTTFYGYDEIGFVLAKADGSDFQGILDEDGEYMRALKLYYDANQLGLVDPESTTQNWDTLFSKFQNGQVLFSWWPWLGQSAFNTEENAAQGIGFQMLDIDDMQIFSYGAEAFGGKQVLAIGSGAEDPERIAAFIDWLYSPEGTYANSAQTMAAPGPQGLTWDLNDAGEPELTELGTQVFLQGGANVPEEWGGGAFVDGVSTLNVNVVLPASVDPNTGFQFSYTFWPSFQEATQTPLLADWSEQMGGATTTMQFLVDNDKLLVAPGASFTAPADASDIETLRNQVKDVIKQYSWQMVFADNDAQYESLKSDLIEKATGLGYDQVLEVDLANAQAQDDARVAVVKEFAAAE